MAKAKKSILEEIVDEVKQEVSDVVEKVEDFFTGDEETATETPIEELEPAVVTEPTPVVDTTNETIVEEIKQEVVTVVEDVKQEAETAITEVKQETENVVTEVENKVEEVVTLTKEELRWLQFFLLNKAKTIEETLKQFANHPMIHILESLIKKGAIQ